MSEIWFAMSIPFITAAVLLLFFQHKTKWWELGIPILASLILCAGFSKLAEYSATKDSELWGGWVTSSHHYDRWNEYIHKTCTRTVSCGKDCTTTQTYDCSYVQNHPEYWAVKDSNKSKHTVTQSVFNHFITRFGMSPQFVDMQRRYHTRDGDMQQVLWPQTNETIDPITTEHTYENRVQAARSVFSYQSVSRDDAQLGGLFDYPEVSLFNTPSIMGDCGTNGEAANKRLEYFNGTLGREKQLRIWLLCFPDGDLSKGHMQEAYWVGGNKNEVVVAVGLHKEGTVSWVHPFSWTDDKTPIYEIRDFISAQEKFDAVAAVEFIGPTLKAGFVRKHFEDFSYLTVEPPLWSVITTFVVTILINIGLSWYIVNNEFHEGRARRRR